MQASQYSHESGNAMILHEGNQAVGIKGDIIHGTSNLFTYFRNVQLRVRDGENRRNVSGRPVFLQPLLQLRRQRARYRRLPHQLSRNVRELGVGARKGRRPIPSDPVVATTIMRWGNYDTATGTSRFVASEVPSGIAKYPNAVPGSQALPASFYLTSKPSWFGSNPWPAIGPDISGGTGPGNHVMRIPARVCFEDVMGGTFAEYSPRAFDASDCYGSGDGVRRCHHPKIYESCDVLR